MVSKLMKIFVLVGGFGVVFFCFMAYAFLMIPTSGNSSSTSVDNNRLFRYQTLEVNPSKNEVSTGFTTEKEYLGLDDFLSFKNDQGNYELISNFGSEQYQCTGTCHCGSSRTSSTVASKTLVYLVAAVSTAFAMNIARVHFSKECQESMKDECPPESITAVLDYCNPQETFDDLILSEKESNELTFFDDTRKRFLCRGWCAQNRQMKYTSRIGLKKEKDGKEETLRCQDLMKAAKVYVYEKGTIHDDYENAREKFREFYLTEMCDVKYKYLGCTKGEEDDDNIHCKRETISKIKKDD